MSPAAAVRTAFRKTVTFSGRAPRTELWWWRLFTILAAALIAVVVGVLAQLIIAPSASPRGAIQGWQVGAVAYVLLAIPSFALVWRRFQDVGLPGWVSLLWISAFALGLGAQGANALLPMTLLYVAGWLLYLLNTVVAFWPSSAGDNRYGPEPPIGARTPLGPTPTRRVGFVRAIGLYLGGVVRFSGRSRLPEMAWPMVGLLLVWSLVTTTPLLLFVMGFVDAGLALLPAIAYAPFLFFALWLPSIALVWRRLQDVGTPGWVGGVLMLLIAIANVGLFQLSPTRQDELVSDAFARMFVTDPQSAVVALALAVISFVLTITLNALVLGRSDPGDNRFGPEPGRSTPDGPSGPTAEATEVAVT